MEKFRKLSKTELQFMKEIWEHPEGITSEIIYSKFSQAQGTKSTILHRIIEKGYVNFIKKGKRYIYTAKITQAEYEEILTRQTMKKLKDTLIPYFYDKELTDSELNRIRDFLEELKNE